jgi:hypothetical protein
MYVLRASQGDPRNVGNFLQAETKQGFSCLAFSTRLNFLQSGSRGGVLLMVVVVVMVMVMVMVVSLVVGVVGGNFFNVGRHLRRRSGYIQINMRNPAYSTTQTGWFLLE